MRPKTAQVSVTCPDCGSENVALRWPDGSIEPIGPPSARCGCGSSVAGSVTITPPETNVGPDRP